MRRQTDDKDREPTHGIIQVLIDQARRDEALISQIADAVSRDDKDEVFNLATELTAGGSAQACRPVASEGAINPARDTTLTVVC